jgi:UDP-glucose 4-epimerase
MTRARVLLTGAAGYIASHTWLALHSAGFEVVGVDNFVNSSPEVLTRLRRLSGAPPVFERIDVLDQAALASVFSRHPIDAVIHFAALKAVGESSAKPLEYYQNNLGALMSVLRVMGDFGVKNMVFSSSATVYGTPETLPLREDSPLCSTSPYGATKWMGEMILRDVVRARPDLSLALLRYFNPVGAHESGEIGEDPRGTPNNLMPYIAQVAVGRRERLTVFGNDYPTPDGTGVRDYIHVLDLADGHVAALCHLIDKPSCITVNLGTGCGHSVLELVRAFEQASGRAVPFEIAARRPGDVAACYADVSLARELLGWQSRRDLRAMCEDSWRWQSHNPNGYDS